MFCSNKECREALNEENAGSSSTLKGGYCHVCERARAFRQRKTNPRRFILYRVKGNAKARNIEFSLTYKDIPPIPEFCPVFPWIRLEYKVGEGCRENSPSLDRIDNNKGYIPGNVRIISFRANDLKKDATRDELERLAQDAKKPFKPKIDKTYISDMDYGFEEGVKLSFCSCGRPKQSFQKLCSVCWFKQGLKVASATP